MYEQVWLAPHAHGTAEYGIRYQLLFSVQTFRIAFGRVGVTGPRV